MWATTKPTSMTAAEKNWKDFTSIATKARSSRLHAKRLRDCVYAAGGMREQHKAYKAQLVCGVNAGLRRLDDDELTDEE